MLYQDYQKHRGPELMTSWLPVSVVRQRFESDLEF